MGQRVLVSFLIVLFAGCAAMISRTSPMNGNPVPPELELEEASVYKGVIEAMYVKEGTKLIVLRDYTVPGQLANGSLDEQLQRVAKELPLLSQETITDFVRKNSEAQPLSKSLKLDVDLKLISESETKAIFQGGEEWQEFYEKYPGSQGILDLSKVAFNREITQALVYVANQGSWKGGAGFYVLLTKENNAWKIESKYTSWVS
jgi:hypothetical protein